MPTGAAQAFFEHLNQLAHRKRRRCRRAAPVHGAAHSGQRKNSAIRIRTGIGTPSIQSNK
jgi:hypothetical protein